MLTDEQLRLIMPNAPKAKREASLPILNAVAAAYDISNERRMAAWLATLAVESGELRYQEEIASGAAYEGRKDLGNTQKGDGRKFKGHGRIQVTGRTNHQAYTNYLKKSGHLPFVDFMTDAKALAAEPYATDSAGWFFAKKIKANPLADAGDFLRIQIKVNGRNQRTGLPNHWKERNASWVKGLSVLPDNFRLTKSSAKTPPDKPARNLLQSEAALNGAALESVGTVRIDGILEAGSPVEIKRTEEIKTPEGKLTEETTTGPTMPNVVIEKREELGFFASIWKKITGLAIFNGGMDALTEKAQQVQALGLSPAFWTKIGYLVLVGTLVYLLFEAYRHFSRIREEHERDLVLARENSTPTNFVQFAKTEYLPEFKAAGYKVITR